MANGPTLSLHIRAEIEKAKDRIFQDKKRFSLLFLPVRNSVVELAEMLNPSTRTTAPRQRMPSALHVQIEDFTGSLFDAEARHYSGYAPDADVLRVWLNKLAAEISALAKRQVTDERLDFHLTLEQRGKIIVDTLKEHVEHWSDPKTTRFTPLRKPSSSVPEQSPVAPAPQEATRVPARSKRLPSTITSRIAAQKLEAFLEASPIEKTDFAGKVETTTRTLLRFRRTGKINRETLRKIAEQMGTTSEKLVKPD